MVGFTGVRPPATPGLGVAGEGAEEAKEEAASTLVGSSELGRWGIGGATRSKNRRRSGSVGVRSDAVEVRVLRSCCNLKY